MGEEELWAAFLASGRTFLRYPEEATLRTLLGRYSLWHVAHHGSEDGLEAELAKIEAQCRNIMAGLP